MGWGLGATPSTIVGAKFPSYTCKDYSCDFPGAVSAQVRSQWVTVGHSDFKCRSGWKHLLLKRRQGQHLKNLTSLFSR